MKKFLLALAALALASPAVAQRTPVYQDGSAVRDHIAKYLTNGLIGQAGGIHGDANGNGVGPFSIDDRRDLGLCLNSAPTNGGYSAFCLGHDFDGNALLSLDSYGNEPNRALSFRINGLSYPFPFTGTGAVGDSNSAATNAAMKLVLGNPGQHIDRLGFNAVGDGGAARYYWSNTPCLAPDDGAQVMPSQSASGCWVADFSNARPTPMVWGARGDGTTDDTARVQAAITAMANSTLYLGRHRYCIGSPGLLVSRPTTILGEGPSNRYETAPSGFNACATDIPIITFGVANGFASDGSRIQDVYIDAGTAGANTSQNSRGIVFNFTSWTVADHVRINKACIGIEEAVGNSNLVSNSLVTSQALQMPVGCVGIRVGHSSTYATDTDFHLYKTTVEALVDASLWIEDAGGMFIESSDFLFAKNGVVINPGDNQFVLWMFASNTALSDTTCNSGLVINAAASTGTVSGLSFSNTWTATAGTSPATGCSGNGVFLENTGGGTVKGIEFTSHRSINSSQHGMLINPGVYNVSVNGGMFCNNSVESLTYPSNVYNGITVAANVSSFSIRNATISGDCYGAGANSNLQGTGVFLLGNNADLSITNNFLRANLSAPINFSGSPPFNSVVIKDNMRNEDFLVNIDSAATIILPMSPISAITGTGGTITTVNNMWDGREAVLYMRDGSVTLGGGGNLCSGGVFPQFTTAILRKIPAANCISVK